MTNNATNIQQCYSLGITGFKRVSTECGWQPREKENGIFFGSSGLETTPDLSHRVRVLVLWK